MGGTGKCGSQEEEEEEEEASHCKQTSAGGHDILVDGPHDAQDLVPAASQNCPGGGMPALCGD